MEGVQVSQHCFVFVRLLLQLSLVVLVHFFEEPVPLLALRQEIFPVLFRLLIHLLSLCLQISLVLSVNLLLLSKHLLVSLSVLLVDPCSFLVVSLEFCRVVCVKTVELIGMLLSGLGLFCLESLYGLFEL